MGWEIGVLCHGGMSARLRALCPQKSQRSGGQVVVEELTDEVEALHHVLASIKEVWSCLVLRRPLGALILVDPHPEGTV